FSEADLAENVKALVDALAKAKPSGAKGKYFERIALSSSMGPGVKIELGSVTDAA
ncbi:MAG: 50S ribosomal protein L1, partial [Sphingomonadales bacterium]